MACTTLAVSVPLQYVLLTGKHFAEQMESASLVALSRRQAVIEACRRAANLRQISCFAWNRRWERKEVPEFYAKVLRPRLTQATVCLIHFTSVPPGVRARLRRLLDQTTAH